MYYILIFIIGLCSWVNSNVLKHIMDVYYYLSNKIYESEAVNNKYLSDHANILKTSSIIQDMCDKSI